MKYVQDNASANAQLGRLQPLLLTTRVVMSLAIAAVIVLAWVLFAQYESFTIDGLQTIRMSIFIAGLLGLGALTLSSRWATRRDQIIADARYAAMREEEQANLRFQTALEYSMVPKVLVDRDDFITVANPAFATLVSRTPSELIGSRIDQLTTTLPEEPAGAPQVTTLREEVKVDYCTITRPFDQSVRILRRMTVPIPRSLNESYSKIVQFDDLTGTIEDQRMLANDKRILEERVEQRTRALQIVNSELEGFAYSVSHDLRGPLRAIDGFGQVLRHSAADKLDPTELQYLDRIISATQKMGELIDSLLRMSRLSTAQLDMTDLDLTQLVNDVLLDVRTEHPGHQAVVKVDEGMRVRGDRVLLRHAFANLIGNSFKFSRNTEHPQISIRMVNRNRYWNEVAISDNGVGFEQQYAEKLFRPFQRLHRSDEFEGHGIGLASVKRVVDRHGGTLSATGEPGQGATINMTLPVAGGAETGSDD